MSASIQRNLRLILGLLEATQDENQRLQVLNLEEQKVLASLIFGAQLLASTQTTKETQYGTTNA